MDFGYEVVRLWERPAEELLAADLGVVPLAMLGRLPEGLSLEEGLASVAQRMVERLKAEPANQRNKLLTDAYLLAGLRVRRDVAKKIFRGVWAMHDSDTFLAILDEGKEEATRSAILAVGEERLGSPEKSLVAQFNLVTDLDRLKRMVRRAAKAISWQEILDTP